jgi:hypothetical protein
MSYTDTSYMKTYLKTAPILLIAALFAATLQNALTTNTSCYATNATINNTTSFIDIADLISKFVIEEIIIEECAYIRGHIDSAILGSVIVKNVKIVHCGEKIYVSAELFSANS